MLRNSLCPVVLVPVLIVALCLPLPATKNSTERIASYAKYVEIPGAKPVGTDTCRGCHEGVAKDFGHAFHAQQGVECEDCHGAGSLHVDGGGDVAQIVVFNKRTAEEANGVCLGCHAQGEKLRNWTGGSHSANHLRCMDCHQIHTAALKAASESQTGYDRATRGTFTAVSGSPETNVIVRPRWETNNACLKCHQTENAQLSMPYHHPLREGKMSCVDCHDPHGGPDGHNLKTANMNQLCLSCHAQYRGPFAYQHPPVAENCMTCHTAHGSPNTNLLQVSEPALCLQCHAGHHNGANLPVTDRCTNCHSSIHGTDVATPSGGSRFIDKGPVGVPSEPTQPAQPASTISTAGLNAMHGTLLRPTYSGLVAGSATSAIQGALSALPPMSGGNMGDPGGGQGGTEVGGTYSAYSLTPASYRFVDGTGYLGRVGEYDSLQQSAGANAATTYVDPQKHLTAVFRGNVITGDDYSATAQVTAGQLLQAYLDLRSFLQQQDHYPSYLPVLSSDFATPGANTDTIPTGADFALKRRMGEAYGRFKVPKLPIHLFVKGNWQARVGESQLTYLDENTTAAVYAPNPNPPPAQINTTCGQLCHFSSQFQPVNYTTRNVGGGVEVDLGKFKITWEHTFSSFNDRLAFPTGTYTGPFTPENEGFSIINPPPSGPAPTDFPAGNYYLDIPPPSQSSTDSVRLNWTASPQLTFNGQVSYLRLRDTFTNNPQNSFDTDNTLNWRPINRLRVTVDYHQQNLINDFEPYYTLYGNVSYHHHWEGLRVDYELPKGFDVESYYQRSGITRSNASLWPQIYSMDNTDLLTVVPSSFSNTLGLVLRYHDRGYWSARAGYEWTGTHDPGYLIVPQSNNRVFADVWITPAPWLVFSNDFSAIVQNDFPEVPLPNTPGEAPGFGGAISGLPTDYQRRDRFYYETLSATLRPSPDWSLGLGYSYQQNNLATYMAFQNDSSVGYVIDEPLVPYKQLTQAYWADTSYIAGKRLGVNLKITYNSSRSGMRPDLNPSDAAKFGNAALISQGIFDPNGFLPFALGNLALASTQISEVIVPQWIGQGKVYYLFPRKFEGGFIFYYGSYRDYWNPNLNGVLRTATLYVGKSW